MKNLFVCGAPRSGTTAMWRLLVGDERIILGVERYGNLFFKHPLKQELFQRERFLDNRPGDTFYSDLVGFNDYYRGLEGRFDQAAYVGDKIPLLYGHLKGLFQEMPQAKVVFMLRNVFDVAASYEARANNPHDDSWSRDKRTPSALQDWRRSLLVLKEYIDDGRVLPVVYEDFFFQGMAGLDGLYAFLGLEVTPRVRTEFQALLSRSGTLERGRKRDLPLQALMQIAMEAPFGLYRELVDKARSLA